ncbi:MAG: hypothetical protein HYV26_17060 [Candidatus Hydrogenedentes bacterium]|nr:hypothetical protein [Candidatus Hydrogenedentota bacterium]MBI3117813.1 hypothetical protein [Candidatus Hydrogenedentota bacterium]
MLRPRKQSGVLALAVFVLGVQPVFAINPDELQQTPVEAENADYREHAEYHGFILDDQYKLIVEHKNDTAIIKLHKWQRPPGGPFLFYDEETGEEESIIRYEDQIELLRIRAEVLIPAPPNYLKNPGLRYRITINGITVAPDFHTVFESNAGNALGAVFSEITDIYNRAEGIYRTAIYYGAIVALRVLNQTAHLPAELPIGTMKSRSAQLRIEGEYLTRRAQPRVERFPVIKGAQEYAQVFSEDEDVVLTEKAPEQGSRNVPLPGSYGQGPVAKGSYRTKHAVKREATEDHRGGQLASISDQKGQKNPLGRAGKALTAPEHDYPAISAAQVENLDLLLGETKSAMEMRMELQPPQRPVPGARRSTRPR